MIKSMTGYGRGEFISDNKKFVVEIKSVNHRYNDISIKLPRSMMFLEDKIKKAVSKSILRGKTDIYINFESLSNEDISVKLNIDIAKAYMESLNMLKKSLFKNTVFIDSSIFSLVAKFPDVITIEKEEFEEETIFDNVYIAIDKALTEFIDMRTTEGELLKKDIISKNENIKNIIIEIEKRAPFVVLEYREKLKLRLSEFLNSIDENRISTEIAIFADRCCIDEEVIRLKSHIIQLEKMVKDGGLVGRKLDFLVQEMNRETNTIASKSNDVKITQLTIELKSEIEKIREQIQNIE